MNIEIKTYIKTHLAYGCALTPIENAQIAHLLLIN